MNLLTETEKAYLADFIDGEGCIDIHKMKGIATPNYILLEGVRYGWTW